MLPNLFGCRFPSSKSGYKHEGTRAERAQHRVQGAAGAPSPLRPRLGRSQLLARRRWQRALPFCYCLLNKTNSVTQS